MTQKPSGADQFLDLLLDALLERNAARRGQSIRPQPRSLRSGGAASRTAAGRAAAARTSPCCGYPIPATQPRRNVEPGDEGWEPPARLAQHQHGQDVRLAVDPESSC